LSRIAIEATSLARPHRSGVAVYGANLIGQLARLDRENRYFLCYRLSRLRQRRFFLRVEAANFQRKMIQEPWNRLFMNRVDLYHGLDARVYAGGRARKIMTVHDVLHYSDAFPVRPYPESRTRRFREMLRVSDRIIAVSESTRAEILRAFPVSADKIRVIRLGVEERFRPREEAAIAPVLRRYGIRRPYLLYLGCLEKRKNLVRLLEAFAVLKDNRYSSLGLVLAGEAGEGAEEVFRAVERLHLGQRVFLPGYVRGEDLPEIYAGSEVFLYPSLYEGFGLPVLEAMACGTPVVCSRATSLPEVAGEAALLVDPHRPEDMAEAVARLLGDPALRREHRCLGLDRARTFDWERTARETLQVYREVLEAEPGKAASGEA